MNTHNTLKLLLLTLGLLFTSTTMAFSYTLEIPETELQERIDALLPIETKKLLTTITISDGRVSLLRETDDVALFAHIATKVPGGLGGSGSLEVHGQVKYDAMAGSFYLKDAKIHSMTVKNLPAPVTHQLKGVAEQFLRQMLNRYPVYTLKEHDTKQKMAKAAIKDIRVKDGVLAVTLSPF